MPMTKQFVLLRAMTEPAPAPSPGSFHTFAARLRFAMERAGKSNQSELAREIGIKPQAIQYLLEPKNNASGSRHITKLAAALGTPSHWLATGEGDFEDPGLAISAKSQGDSLSPAAPSRGDVPLISWVQAGAWNPAADPFQPGEAETWLPCPAIHSTSTFALRVRGDSMTAAHGNSKTYPENSIIYVDPERRSPVNGQRIIAVLLGGDEVTFKVYKEEDGRRWLMPLNPSHEPIREEFAVLGTVIGKWEDD
jgi:SOS-response transcriptional repressor LexA